MLDVDKMLRNHQEREEMAGERVDSASKDHNESGELVTVILCPAMERPNSSPRIIQSSKTASVTGLVVLGSLLPWWRLMLLWKSRSFGQSSRKDGVFVLKMQ